MFPKDQNQKTHGDDGKNGLGVEIDVHESALQKVVCEGPSSVGWPIVCSRHVQESRPCYGPPHSGHFISLPLIPERLWLAYGSRVYSRRFGVSGEGFVMRPFDVAEGSRT